MMKLMPFLLVLTVFLISSCAHSPNFKLGYYHPKLKLKIKIDHTAMCTKKDDSYYPIVLSKSTIGTDYAAEPKLGNPRIEIGKMGSWLTKTEVKIGLTPDGRLKTVNSVSTGQASEALTSITGILTTVLTQASMFTSTDQQPLTEDQKSEVEKKITEACKILKQYQPTGETPATIAISASTDFGLSGTNKLKSNEWPQTCNSTQINKFLQTLDFRPINIAYEDYQVLSNTILGRPYIVSEKQTKCVHEASFEDDTDNGQKISAIDPAIIDINVMLLNELLNSATILEGGTVAVPQLGVKYEIPLPKDPLFGNNTVNIIFDDSGRPTQIDFTNNSGASDALSSIKGLAEATHESASEKAARLKNEADSLIHAQKIVVCKADPTKCE